MKSTRTIWTSLMSRYYFKAILRIEDNSIMLIGKKNYESWKFSKRKIAEKLAEWILLVSYRIINSIAEHCQFKPGILGSIPGLEAFSLRWKNFNSHVYTYIFCNFTLERKYPMSFSSRMLLVIRPIVRYRNLEIC